MKRSAQWNRASKEPVTIRTKYEKRGIKTMKLRRSVVCVAALLTLVASGSAEPCPAVESSGPELDLMCLLSSGTEIELNWHAREYVTLECHGNGTYTCAELPRVSPTSAPPFSAMLKNCALPVNESLTCTLQALGAPAATSLTLRGVPGGAAALLTPKHVHGLVNLTALKLVGTGSDDAYTHLPTAALAALPSLRSLRINGAHLRLTPDSLAGVSGLDYLELSSSDIKELDANVFRGLESLRTLNLWGNDLRKLQDGTFEGLKVLDTLDLSTNPLQTLGEGVLAAASNLRVLRLVDTELGKLDEPTLRNLTALEELIVLDGRKPVTVGSRSLALPKLNLVKLERCSLKFLPGDALTGARSLRSLSLSYNSLEKLPSELLRDSGDLRILDLSHNALQALPSGLFKSLWHLEELYLDHNHIEEFSDNLFDSLGSLQSLSAHNNRLRVLSPTIFQGARALRSLDLAHNELTLRPAEATVINVADGYTDFLDGQMSPMNMLTRLQRLDLSHNLIKDVFNDWRIVMLNLTLLNLTNNRIEVLMNPDVIFLSKDVIVDFRYNQITTVQITEEVQMARIDDDEENAGSGRLLLDGNPFHCDCLTYWLLRLINNPSYAHISPTIKLDAAVCASPPALANITLRSAPIDKLTCQLTAPDCPDNCSCTLHPSAYAMEFNCIEPPATVPPSIEFGLNRTVLRLRNPPPTLNLSLPVHELILAGLGLTLPPPGPVPSELELLDLTNNQLTEVPPTLDPLGSYKLRLAHNPLECNCAHSVGLKALQRSAARIKDWQNVTCKNGDLLRLKDVTGLCAGARAAWAAGIGGTLALLGLITSVVAILWLRYQNEIKVWLFARGWCGCLTRSGKEVPAKYDAFLSFSHKDEELVVHKLVPELERRGYRLCVHYRDWAPGESIAEHVSRSVHEARRTLVVASPGFLSSEWARAEFRAAHARALREGRARVIVILLGELPAPDVNAQDDDLRTYLRTNTYVKWGDPWFWEKLQYALPHRPLGEHKEALPLVPVAPGTLSADALRAALAVHMHPKDKLNNGLEPRLLPPPAL